MKLAESKNLWAPVTAPKRGTPWVLWHCIAYRKRDAKAAYLRDYLQDQQREALSRVRFVRVTVKEQQP